MDIDRIKTFLFVPANRPDRIGKALTSGADAVIVDLEDAVAPGAKDTAREALITWLEASTCPVFVRINGPETQWHAGDVLACCSPAVTGIFLPKAESAAAMLHVHAVTGKPVLPIIESALGVHHLGEIARAPGCARLAFGKLDLAIDLGLEPDEDDKNETVFQPYRAQLTLASRLSGLPPPVDGVYTALDDVDGLAGYTRRARRDGFGGVLLIHPRQAATVAACLSPSDAEIAWACRVLFAAEEARGSAAVVDGRMIDAPVIARAQRLLAARAT